MTPRARASPASARVDESGLRAVLIDIDDTLVDTRAAFREALAELTGRWLPHLDGAGGAAVLAHWTGDVAGHFRAYTRGEIDFREQRRRRVGALHAAFGGPQLDEAAFTRWDAEYERAFRAAWRPFPDAEPFLAWLQAQRLPFGAVTNAGRAYQRAKLEAVGLADRLPILVGTDTLGVGKPDPRVWWHACAALQVPVGATAYIGDELDVDARGAHEAGLIGIWLDRHGEGLDPSDVPWTATLDGVPALLAPAEVDLGGRPGAR